MPIAYIYKLYNENGYYYYGSTKNVNMRFRQHVLAATRGKNSKLYNKMREEGISTFKIEIVETAILLRRDDILKIESSYIKPVLNDEMNLNKTYPCLTDSDIEERTVICGDYRYIQAKPKPTIKIEK